jgi:hypothetical protein
MNDLQRALDSIADGPNPDFVARLAGDIEREMTRTTTDTPISHHLGLLEAPTGRGQLAPARGHVWRTSAAIVASVAVIAIAVALANPFRHTTAPIHTGSTLTVTTTRADDASAPTASPTKIEPTTTNEPNAMTVTPTPAEWEALPAAPLDRREHPLVIAIGKEVLVVGGINHDALIVEGAVLNGNSWRLIPNAPSAVDDSVPAAWTGSAVIAVGIDGHVISFTPASDRWEVLSIDETHARIGATAVWSGSELLVAGGSDPRAPTTPGQVSPLLGAVAFNPATRTWRTLPVPPGTDPLLGPSAWTGTEWIRVSASSEGQPAPTKVAAFDPTTNRWRTLPDLRGQVSAVVRVGASIAVYNLDQFGPARFRLNSDAWIYDGTVPTWERATIKDAYVVDGVELATGYLTISYRQAGGGWGWIPNPISLAGDEKYVQTSGGDIVAYAAGKAARLRPISDPTVGLPPCNGRDFSSKIEHGTDTATIVLTNTGPTCRFNDADERHIEFRVSGDWVPIDHDGQLSHGGLGYVVDPNGRVSIMLSDADLGAYGRSPCTSPPAATGPIDGVRFTLSSFGDPIVAVLPVPAGCVGLTFSTEPVPSNETTTPTTAVSTVPNITTIRWEALPDIPGKPTFKPLVVALGKDLLVVGGYGSLQPDQVPETAGAIYDGQTWRAIPDAPVPLAAEMSAVWTGSTVLAVSADGTILSFTPGPDQWDVLGHAPPPNRIGAEVVWTGDEMLFASGGLPGITELQGGMNIINEAVAYRPSTKVWRTIPRPPTKDPLTGPSVWTGKEWVRMVGWSEGKFDDFGSIAAYDPRSNRWRQLPSLAATQPPTAILMEGNDLVAYTTTERWRLVGEAWLSAGALPPVSGYTSGIGEAWFVGGQVILTKTDVSGYFEALELLDATGRWQPLGEPFAGMGADAIMKAVYDRLVVIANGKAARLREP